MLKSLDVPVCRSALAVLLADIRGCEALLEPSQKAVQLVSRTATKEQSSMLALIALVQPLVAALEFLNHQAVEVDASEIVKPIVNLLESGMLPVLIAESALQCIDVLLTRPCFMNEPHVVSSIVSGVARAKFSSSSAEDDSEPVLVHIALILQRCCTSGYADKFALAIALQWVQGLWLNDPKSSSLLSRVAREVLGSLFRWAFCHSDQFDGYSGTLMSNVAMNVEQLSKQAASVPSEKLGVFLQLTLSGAESVLDGSGAQLDSAGSLFLSVEVPYVFCAAAYWLMPPGSHAWKIDARGSATAGMPTVGGAATSAKGSTGCLLQNPGLLGSCVSLASYVPRLVEMLLMLKNEHIIGTHRSSASPSSPDYTDPLFSIGMLVSHCLLRPALPASPLVPHSGTALSASSPLGDYGDFTVYLLGSYLRELSRAGSTMGDASTSASGSASASANGSAADQGESKTSSDGPNNKNQATVSPDRQSFTLAELAALDEGRLATDDQLCGVSPVSISTAFGRVTPSVLSSLHVAVLGAMRSLWASPGVLSDMWLHFDCAWHRPSLVASMVDCCVASCTYPRNLGAIGASLVEGNTESTSKREHNRYSYFMVHEQKAGEDQKETKGVVPVKAGEIPPRPDNDLSRRNLIELTSWMLAFGDAFQSSELSIDPALYAVSGRDCAATSALHSLLATALECSKLQSAAVAAAHSPRTPSYTARAQSRASLSEFWSNRKIYADACRVASHANKSPKKLLDELKRFVSAHGDKIPSANLTHTEGPDRTAGSVRSPGSGRSPESDAEVELSKIVWCLRNLPGLEYSKLGEFLGSPNPEAEKALYGFVKMLNLEAMDPEEALRACLTSFRLPGEAQQIDRIVKTIGYAYCESHMARPEDIPVEVASAQPNIADQSEGASVSEEASKDDSSVTTESESVANSTVANSTATGRVARAVADVARKLPVVAAETALPQGASSTGTSLSCFKSPDAAYVLLFSTVMLHTDQHNPQVKKRMEFKDFMRNNRGLNAGEDFPEEMLRRIFASIRAQQIVTPDSGDVFHAPLKRRWLDAQFMGRSIQEGESTGFNQGFNQGRDSTNSTRHLAHLSDLIASKGYDILAGVMHVLVRDLRDSANGSGVLGLLASIGLLDSASGTKPSNGPSEKMSLRVGLDALSVLSRYAVLAFEHSELPGSPTTLPVRRNVSCLRTVFSLQSDNDCVLEAVAVAIASCASHAISAGWVPVKAEHEPKGDHDSKDERAGIAGQETSLTRSGLPLGHWLSIPRLKGAGKTANGPSSKSSSVLTNVLRSFLLGPTKSGSSGVSGKEAVAEPALSESQKESLEAFSGVATGASGWSWKHSSTTASGDSESPEEATDLIREHVSRLADLLKSLEYRSPESPSKNAGGSTGLVKLSEKPLQQDSAEVVAGSGSADGTNSGQHLFSLSSLLEGAASAKAGQSDQAQTLSDQPQTQQAQRTAFPLEELSTCFSCDPARSSAIVLVLMDTLNQVLTSGENVALASRKVDGCVFQSLQSGFTASQYIARVRAMVLNCPWSFAVSALVLSTVPIEQRSSALLSAGVTKDALLAALSTEAGIAAVSSSIGALRSVLYAVFVFAVSYVKLDPEESVVAHDWAAPVLARLVELAPSFGPGLVSLAAFTSGAVTELCALLRSSKSKNTNALYKTCLSLLNVSCPGTRGKLAASATTKLVQLSATEVILSISSESRKVDPQNETSDLSQGVNVSQGGSNDGIDASLAVYEQILMTALDSSVHRVTRTLVQVSQCLISSEKRAQHSEIWAAIVARTLEVVAVSVNACNQAAETDESAMMFSAPDIVDMFRLTVGDTALCTTLDSKLCARVIERAASLLTALITSQVPFAGELECCLADFIRFFLHALPALGRYETTNVGPCWLLCLRVCLLFIKRGRGDEKSAHLSEVAEQSLRNATHVMVDTRLLPMRDSSGGFNTNSGDAARIQDWWKISWDSIDAFCPSISQDMKQFAHSSASGSISTGKAHGDESPQVAEDAQSDVTASI